MYMCDVYVNMGGLCVHVWERCWQVGYVDVRKYVCACKSACVVVVTHVRVFLCVRVHVCLHVCGFITSTSLGAPAQAIVQYHSSKLMYLCTFVCTTAAYKDCHANTVTGDSHAGTEISPC